MTIIGGLTTIKTYVDEALKPLLESVNIEPKQPGQKTYVKGDYIAREDAPRLQKKTISIYSKLEKIGKDTGDINLEISKDRINKFARELNFSLTNSKSVDEMKEKLLKASGEVEKLDQLSSDIKTSKENVGLFSDKFYYSNENYFTPGNFHGYVWEALEDTYKYARSALDNLKTLNENKTLHPAVKKKIEGNIADLEAVLPEIQDFRKDAYRSMIDVPEFQERMNSNQSLCDYYFREAAKFKDADFNQQLKDALAASQFKACLLANGGYLDATLESKY